MTNQDNRGENRPFKGISDGIVFVDADGTIVWSNTAAAPLLGTDPADVEGVPVDVVVPEVDLEEKTVDCERRVGDEVRMFEVKVNQVGQTHGDSEWVLVARDVTDRLRETKRLREHEQILDAVPGAVYALDEDGTFTYANAATESLTGHDSIELVGSHVSLAFSPAEDEPTGDVADLLTDEGRPRTTTLTVDAAENRESVLETTVVRLQNSPHRVVGVLRDVSEIRELERELGRYETIIQALADPVYATDADGYFTFINDAFIEQGGYTLEEIEDVHFSEFVRPEDVERVLDVLRELLSDETDRDQATVEIQGVMKDGRRVTFEDHLALLPYDEEYQGVAGVLRPIDDQKRREEVMRVVNRALRHNLRTHVNAIDGYAEMLVDTGGGSAEYAQRIRESAGWIGKLAESLRTLQQAIEEGAGHDTTHDIGDLVAEVVARYDEEYPSATLQTHVPDESTVTAGPALRHAIDHVVENAIVHNDREAPEVHVWVTSAPQRGWIDVKVEDDGPGIPAAEREVVLGEAEMTQLQHGSGIGLWMTRWIVQAFDGAIDIDDADPRGTEVTLRLRRAEGPDVWGPPGIGSATDDQ